MQVVSVFLHFFCVFVIVLDCMLQVNPQQKNEFFLLKTSINSKGDYPRVTLRLKLFIVYKNSVPDCTKTPIYLFADGVK